MTLFSVGSIPVRVHPTLALMLAAIAAIAVARQGIAGLREAVLGTVALLGSVLFHELGHAWMGRRLGLNALRITLSPIGGAVQMDAVETTPRVDVLVALAGPVASLWLGSLLAITYQFAPSKNLWFWMALNFGLGIGNLIPAFPLDGGRVLRGFLAVRYGAYRGAQIAMVVAVVITAILAFSGWWFGQIYLLVALLPMTFILRREWIATTDYFHGRR